MGIQGFRPALTLYILVCTVTEEDWKLEILDLRRDGSIDEAKTKGADQLCLCFQNGKKEFFFMMQLQS